MHLTLNELDDDYMKKCVKLVISENLKAHEFLQ